MVVVLGGLAIQTTADPPASTSTLDTHLRKYKPGELILDYDQDIDTFFILKSGRLTAEQRNTSEADNVNAYHLAKITIENPDWYGNEETYFAAIFGFLGDPSFVRVTATEPTEIYVLPADMEKLMDISPEVAHQLVMRLLRLVKKRENQIVKLRNELRGRKQ